MNRKSRELFTWVLFAVALLGLLLGWLWVIERLVKQEAEISASLVREAEEKALKNLAGRFDRFKFEDWKVDDQLVTKIAKEGRVAGVWSEEFNKPGPISESKGSWPETDGIVTCEALLEAIQKEESMAWGHVIEGRDQLGSLVLRIARKEGALEELRELLEEGVWQYEGLSEPMAPGFRLLLIRELEKISPSEELTRLKRAEKIRAVDGRIEELDEVYEVLEGDQGTRWFLTRTQLEEELGIEGVMLTAERPEDRSAVNIDRLSVWPFLSLRSDSIENSSAVRKSGQAVIWVGMVTAILTVALLAMAIWIGRRQLRMARSRTDLAASVAHELRTPLAGQRVVLESLLERGNFDRDYLEMALHENQRLGGLAEEFLTYSQLERGTRELALHPLDLANVVSSQVNDDEIDFQIEARPTVLADVSAVETIARNLIENAIKYSDQKGGIVVRVFEMDALAGFSVRDEGVGLSPKEYRKIFRQFYRVDRQLSRSQEGLGLGLSIVKRLADGMGAEVRVKSEIRRGSCFEILFQREGEGQ